MTKKNALVDEAVHQYKRDHWGKTGTGAVREYRSADPRIPSVELGKLVLITYRTMKGSDVELTDYEHHFEKPYPVLSYNRTGLIIAGGGYRVTERGIVG